jgi:transcriptional regulator with XRE-family HTH domain
MTALTEAVRDVLGSLPVSMRRLASEAGVPVSTLSRIASGQLGASPAVARAIADALDAWGADLADAELRIRAELHEGSDQGG